MPSVLLITAQINFDILALERHQNFRVQQCGFCFDLCMHATVYQSVTNLSQTVIKNALWSFISIVQI